MTNLEIAKLLRKIAAAYTILGENNFKIIAYDNAATAVEHATSELQDLWEEGKLDSVPGIGTSIAAHLNEIFKKGKSKHFEEILSKVNPAVFPLLEVPGLGPKRAAALVKSLSLSQKDPIEVLEKAAKEHKIASLEGFGEKSEKDILENIERYKKGAIKENRMDLPTADRMAEEVIKYLREMGEVRGVGEIRVDKLGSLRRQVATIGDIDLSVATDNPKEVIEAFVSYPKTVEVIEQGPTGASILLKTGRQIDLRVSPPENYGAMLQYFTGSKYHNIRLREYALKKGFSLNEYGIKAYKANKTNRAYKFENEEKFYDFLGLDYIHPELREDSGEIDAASKHNLPKLVEVGDIKGDLHMHANYAQETSHDSGVSSIGEMREMGEIRGYEYIGVSDHNPSVAKHIKDQIIKVMKDRKEYFEQLNSSSEKKAKDTKVVRILNLLEVDISPDGTLPLPQEGLNFLDGCLISIHSSFNMSKEAMTKRVLTGLSNPVARILAHPTGRLLGQRDGYDLNWDQIFRFCLEHDKALEINAYPNRLDLPDTLVREAVKRGVKLSLGTDAHVKDDMALMKYGVTVARRGWAEKKNVINTLNYENILGWFKKRS